MECMIEGCCLSNPRQSQLLGSAAPEVQAAANIQVETWALGCPGHIYQSCFPLVVGKTGTATAREAAVETRPAQDHHSCKQLSFRVGIRVGMLMQVSPGPSGWATQRAVVHGAPKKSSSTSASHP